MSIRDLSKWPDDRVPDWVRRRREAKRAGDPWLCSCNLHFGSRGELLYHCDTTGHPPSVVTPEDPFIKRKVT